MCQVNKLLKSLEKASHAYIRQYSSGYQFSVEVLIWFCFKMLNEVHKEFNHHMLTIPWEGGGLSPAVSPRVVVAPVVHIHTRQRLSPS